MKKFMQGFCIMITAGFFMASPFAEDLPSVEEQAKGVEGMQRQGETGTSNENGKEIKDENGEPMFPSTPASGDSSGSGSGDTTKGKN
jgi:hypothetical protein